MAVKKLKNINMDAEVDLYVPQLKPEFARGSQTNFPTNVQHNVWTYGVGPQVVLLTQFECEGVKGSKSSAQWTNNTQ
jgi:hypothetical protein